MTPPVSQARSELGGFRVDSLLTRTAASWIYRGHSVAGGDEVLLEVATTDLSADRGFTEHLEHDSSAARRLGHPNIAVAYATGLEDDLAYVATRDPGGLDLGTLLEGLGAVSLRRASGLVSQIASALDAAHSAGLVHGAVEPARVMVAHRDGADQVVVTGFGFRGSTHPVNGSARPYGLPAAAFAPPEQIRGEEAVPASDVYALGCILYELLIGRPPYDRVGEEPTLAAHLDDPIPAPCAVAPELPLAIDGILRRSLAKDPGDRYESPADLASELEAAAEGDNTPEAVSARKEHTVTRWDRSLAEGAATWSPSRPVATPPPREPEEPDEEPAAEPLLEAEPPSQAAETEEATEPLEAAEPEEVAEPEEAEPVASTPQPVLETIDSAWPQPPDVAASKGSRRPAASTRRGIPGRLVALAVAIVAAVAVVVLLTTGDSEPDRRAAGGDAPRRSVTPPPAPAPASEPGGLATWPKRDAFTAVIHVSVSDAAPARARARRAAGLGYEAGILDSSDYSSLPPGRTVAFAGVFGSRERAEQAAGRLAEQGVARRPYVRFVNGAAGR